MKSFVCCVMLMVVVVRASPLPFHQAPARIDTPDDGQVGGGGDANPNPQGGSLGSSFIGGDTSSASSSSSSEEDGSVDLPDGDGSVPAGTAQPSGPVIGQGNTADKGKQQEAGGQKGGNQGISDQNSGEQKGGGFLVAGDPAQISKIQAMPKSNGRKSSAGKNAGIAFGVLVLVSVVTGAIIFAIRKRRDGFMRFYSQANAEL